MEGKDNSRTEEIANTSTHSNARLPDRPEPLTESSVLDRMRQHSEGTGRGKPRGKQSFHNNVRGTLGRGRGGHERVNNSFSYSLAHHKPHDDRNTAQDSTQDQRQSLASQQQNMSLGSGSHLPIQQASSRNPYRRRGRARVVWSRPRSYQPCRKSGHSQHVSQGSSAFHSVADHQETYVDQGAGMPNVKLAEGHAENLAAKPSALNATVSPPAMFLADSEGLDVGPHTPFLIEAISPLSIALADKSLPLVSDTFLQLAQPASEHQAEPILGASVSTEPIPPIHFQNLSLHDSSNAVQLSNAHDLNYTWSLPYPVSSGNGGAYTVTFPSPLTMTIAPPPWLHSPHSLSHLHVTYDHAGLALCHPVALIPCTWFPIQYLSYWGPERLGAHPDFYDIPMVSRCRSMRGDTKLFTLIMSHLSLLINSLPPIYEVAFLAPPCLTRSRFMIRPRTCRNKTEMVKVQLEIAMLCYATFCYAVLCSRLASAMSSCEVELHRILLSLARPCTWSRCGRRRLGRLCRMFIRRTQGIIQHSFARIYAGKTAKRVWMRHLWVFVGKILVLQRIPRRDSLGWVPV